ncbi:MAG: DNA/RNA nuclease SfsA [Tissierellaceae bacterium]
MRYKKIIEAIFLKRPNRFIAHVLIDGLEEIAHVKNTGRCAELLIPGARILLEDASDNPNRKTKYSLISVWKGDMLVNMDSQVPNAVVFDALKENKIGGLENLVKLKREVSFGRSRYDIYFETEGKKGFIEVKGVTLEREGMAMFPDAPTERGARHALEMAEAVKEGYKGIIFFLIQMKGPGSFRLNSEMDQKFSDAVEYAVKNGVKVLVYDSLVSEDAIEIGNLIAHWQGI